MSPIRALAVLPAGGWDPAREIGTATLDWDRRYRRRFRIETDQGVTILLDLPQATRMAAGDGLDLGADGVVRVIAADEALMEFGPGSTSLARLAYHLGNRHLKLELHPDRLVIRADPVIADMVRDLGGTVLERSGPFTPEPGAYHGGHRHDLEPA